MESEILLYMCEVIVSNINVQNQIHNKKESVTLLGVLP